MRNILAIFAVIAFLIFMSGCKQDYKEIKISKIEYAKIQIDSSEFEMVLMKDFPETDEQFPKIVIASKDGIREVIIVDYISTVGIIILLILISTLVGFAWGYSTTKP